MKHSLCPTCGHPLAIEMTTEKLGIFLPLRQRRFVEIIERAGRGGISGQALFERMYLDKPNGGPKSGPQIAHVMQRQVNKKLKPLGLQITCRGQFLGFYRLETYKSVAPTTAVGEKA